MIYLNIQYLSETEYLVKDVFVDQIHERPYCIFDLEGTGILVEKEYITQFGAIIYQNGKIIAEVQFLILLINTQSPKAS